MATPHHHTFPTEEQRRRHPQRSLLHRIQLQRPRLPTPSQPARRNLRRAVWRNPKSLPTASLWSWRASESGQRDSTACARRAPPWPRVPPSAPTARPPALLHGAPCAAHILQRHEHHGCSCLVPLRTRTHLQLHAATVARVPHAHADATVPCYAAAASQQAPAASAVFQPHSLGPMGDARRMPLVSPRATVRQHPPPLTAACARRICREWAACQVFSVGRSWSSTSAIRILAVPLSISFLATRS